MTVSYEPDGSPSLRDRKLEMKVRRSRGGGGEEVRRARGGSGHNLLKSIEDVTAWGRYIGRR